MSEQFGELRPPLRVLMGPGPSNTHPRVLAALGAPTIGHLDPAYLEMMNEVSEMLRMVMRTRNRLTFAVSGTGSAGMEAALVNVLEPGDEAVVCINGVFGMRMADIVERCGAAVVPVEVEWGKPVPPQAVAETLKGRGPKVVCLVHAETSTGVLTPPAEIARLARESGALMLLDTVTSLGGCRVEVDAWGVDVCYSGTQKCLSCPPGLAPITFSERALEVVRSRRSKVQSWYLDLTGLERYWGAERVYHHTAPVNMTYGLREALRIVLEEGLEERWERHARVHKMLVEGLAEMGLELLPDGPFRLPMLNAVKVPEGVDEAKVRTALLERFGIEIGAGLGPLKGKVWRVGLMGHTATEANVAYLLHALGQLL